MKVNKFYDIQYQQLTSFISTMLNEILFGNFTLTLS